MTIYTRHSKQEQDLHSIIWRFVFRCGEPASEAYIILLYRRLQVRIVKDDRTLLYKTILTVVEVVTVVILNP